MPSAIDTFRAQREAAEGIDGCLQQVAELLTRLRQEADAIAHNDDLRAVLQREESWRASRAHRGHSARVAGLGSRAVLAWRGTALGRRADLRPCVGLDCRRWLCVCDETMAG